MSKITKVPNGPLVKKKGPFKGSTLKAGGIIDNLKNNNMATMKKAQAGAKMVKEKQNLKDATQMKNMRPIFKGPNVPRAKTTMGSKGVVAKAGKTMKKKMQDGGSLGMKSVKAGIDKNPGITRADIIVAGKSKAKSGKTMKTCKGGC